MAANELHTETVYGWAVEYAKSGRSKCQQTKELIPEGDVRIGKEVDNPFKEGAKMKLWYGYEALFKSFRLGSAKKPRVYSTDELEGFAELESEDQDTLLALTDAENEFRAGLAKVDDDAIRLEHTKNDGVFWSVVQSGATTRVRWGAIGDEGNVSEKEHKDEAAATKFVEKKIAEKEKGGYVRTADAGSKRKAADDKEEDDEVEAPVKAKEAPAAKKAKKEVATKKGKQKEVVAEPAKEEAPAPTAAAASGGGGGDAETVYGWAVEYAKSGRSKCQSTKELIEQGAVRIGKEVDNPFKEGTKMKLWYGYEALFKSFRLGSAKKPRVYSTDELEGFAELESEDQDTLSALIDAENEFRAGLAKVDDDAIRLEHTKNDGVFWSVVQSGATTRVRWGAIGDEGNVSEKEHKDEAAATKFVEKKTAEKEKGGYVRTADAGSKRKAADDKEEDDDDDENENGGGGGASAPAKAKKAPAVKKAPATKKAPAAKKAPAKKPAKKAKK